jgi:hypothetical protein
MTATPVRPAGARPLPRKRQLGTERLKGVIEAFMIKMDESSVVRLDHFSSGLE